MKDVLAFFFALVLASSAARAQVSPLTTADAAVARAKELKLDQRVEWIRLLHYENLFLRGWVSQADGPNFFVAHDGATNPAAELEATVRGFFNSEKRDLRGKDQLSQTVYCQFPARFEFLDRDLGLRASIPKETCKPYEDFLARTSAKSLTLVFSSFFGANPSSIYGHSLIRLNKSDGAAGSEQRQLLDTGVNYAADNTAPNALLYAVYGLSGLLRGNFSILPYYYKVREYADFESRDLWEYDLDLTPEEVKRVTAHIWELSSTYFDYYYLTENCSYHMLSLIEAGAPRLHLIDRIPYWVIPTDTVKALFLEDAVRKINFRPSLYTQFKKRFDSLTEAEKKTLMSLIAQDHKSKLPASVLPDDSLSAASRAHVLDAYMDYFDLHYARDLYQKKPEYVLPKEALLLARSKLPISKPLDFTTTPVASPHLSHGSARASLIQIDDLHYGYATEFAMRFALHDLLDSPLGLPEYTDIDFFHIQARYWEDLKQLKLEKFTVFGVGTYAPLDPFQDHTSWRLKVGAQRFDDARCENCIGGFANGGYGLTVRPFQTLGLLLYVLGEGTFESSSQFRSDHFVVRVGPTLGARFRFTESLAVSSEARYLRALGGFKFDERILDSKLRWVPVKSSFGLELHGLWSSERQEVGAGLVAYF